MIDKIDNPVAWALLAHELSDAQEHLTQLVQEMQEQSEFDETDYRIWLAHIYAHLNRAWNRRNLTDSQAEATPSESQNLFPTDIEPL